MKITTDIWDRLAKVLEVDNLDELAHRLGLNASTLRGRKARGAIPYEQIIQNLDVYEMAYVFKEEKLDKSIDLSELYDHSDIDKKRQAEFEQNLEELTETIKHGSFSLSFKIRVVATLVRIAGEDLEKIEKKLNNSILKDNECNPSLS